MQEFTAVWVRDPRIQKEDFWHAYMDYEICIHTNSLAFTKKSSCVRRRTHLPKLPPKNPFFSLNNAREIGARMEGLRKFLEVVVHSPVLLSDSCLHLFLQSQLSVKKIKACAEGRSRYTVSEAIHNFGSGIKRFESDSEENVEEEEDC
ncbi:sorting nexin-10B isoform X2 [Myxocyprinus asiaticus]|uniref:sorting nexin-10B isoform X2 n=1 Tax=Myxocyprinus asiaticus TaxID=70543 RepID=UPI00222134E6|nr:sorting nexin-10B isoform X2 [Myxocyprinus asiaticus]